MAMRELRLTHLSREDTAFLDLHHQHVFQNLHYLALDICVHLSDDLVSSIITAAPRLHYLSLRQCNNITNAALRSIANLGNSLQELCLDGCREITDDGVKVLLNSCTNIQSIDLSHCDKITDNSVRLLAFLPVLREAYLADCYNITDDSIHEIVRVTCDNANGGERISSKLEQISLSYTKVTLKTAFTLLNSCPNLTSMTLPMSMLTLKQPQIRRFGDYGISDFFVGNVSAFRDFLYTLPECNEFNNIPQPERCDYW